MPRSRQPSDADRELYRQAGAQIRELRGEKGLPQEKLAWSAEISKSYLSEIEAGRKSPSLAVLRALAAELDVPVWSLFIELKDEAVREVVQAALVASDGQLGSVLELLRG